MILNINKVKYCAIVPTMTCINYIISLIFLNYIILSFFLKYRANSKK
jgi:hypothetical protein